MHFSSRRTNEPRASFQILDTPLDGVTFLIDLDQGRTVTNDADAVVLDVLKTHPGERIIYRDTDGNWDELRHDGRRFTGFSPLSAEDAQRFQRVIGPARTVRV